MTLHWRPPKDNGGDDITNYVVEKRKKGSDTWEKVSSSVMGTSYRVRNLKEGQAYDFRVMAENQYGISDPTETMEPITAKSPFGKKMYSWTYFA